MFAAIAMFFNAITNLFSICNRLCSAGDKLAETAEDRATAFNLEQAEENKQRLATLKAKVASRNKEPKPTTLDDIIEEAA